MAEVSILMNGYNAQKYLKEAIDSIFDQTYEDWEIIFIDNCSTDKTKEIVFSYNEKVKYYKTEKNIPLGAARNFGLQFCTGKYLAFLDTDDIWMPEKLKLQIDIMNKNRDFQLCYGGVIYIDESGKEIGRLLPKAASGNVFAQQLMRYEINMQTVLLRNNRSFYFNESLKHSPDFDIFMEIAASESVYVIHKPLVKYRKLENSLTSKNLSVWWREMKFTLDRLFNNKNLKSKYKKEYNYAYAKVAYNKACYLMSIGKKWEATMELSRYKFTDAKYFSLYLTSVLPKAVWDFAHRFKQVK